MWTNETQVLWPPHAKSWLIGKDSDAGRDWGQEEKGTTEDEMAGWHHWLDGRESGWTPGAGDGQGGLACCDSWGRKESDTTERLNWTEWIQIHSYHYLFWYSSLEKVGRPDLLLLSPRSLRKSLLSSTTRCCVFLPCPALNRPLLQRAPFLLEKNPGIPNRGTGHSHHFQGATASLAPGDRSVLRVCVLGHIHIHVNVCIYTYTYLHVFTSVPDLLLLKYSWFTVVC